MKRTLRILTGILLAAATILLPMDVMAVEGTLGFEGGISAVDTDAKDTYYYSEMCFLTGKPIPLTGTLTIKKSVKGNIETATYTYRLENAEHSASLTRVDIYETVSDVKANGQITETTRLTRLPTELITIGTNSYSLIDCNFSKSMITDPKPALNYYAGEYAGKKTYSLNGDRSNTVTVSFSAGIYAYDQYWSSTQTQRVLYTINANMAKAQVPYKWGGSAEVIVSSTTRQQIKYSPNEPFQISFDGGYVRMTWTDSILDYHARLPEMDKNGMPTDVIKDYDGRASLSTQPVLERLMVPDIKQLKGHWSEEAVRILFGLEVIPGTGEYYNINKYLTRREFIVMLMQAVKDIPEDPNVRTPTVAVRSRSKTVEVSPFLDVSVDDPDYALIKKAFEKGITAGTGRSNFNPDSYITYAEAIKMIVAALGLENLAPYPNAITPYPDNDSIPTYARNAAAVAFTLGIFQGDDRGYFNPAGYISNEQAAKLFYNLIRYMGDELVKDYSDRMLAF
jgi:N-acetylmuramoyl-L-alanine amidase